MIIKLFIYLSINYHNEEYKVTALQAGAFQCSCVKTVIFDPDSQIQTIPMFSFQSSCIEKITLSPRITKIERSAFSECENLIEIKIPPDSQLKQIEAKSFLDTKIESLSIPSKLTKLDEGWNNSINGLVNITVMHNNSSYIDVNHEYLLGKSNPNKENFDLLAFASKRIIEAKIPDTVEIIGSYLFQNNSRIESFILPPNVKRINRLAFDKCTSLKKFIIPSNSKLQYLGEYTLMNASITSLVIPNRIRFFHESYFICMNQLNIVQIEENSQLNNITSGPFKYCFNIILMVPVDLNDKVIIENKSTTRNDFLNVRIKDNEGNLNTYRIKNDDSVWSLKKQIESKIKVPLDQIDLRTVNYRFKNDQIVSDYFAPNSNQLIELFTENDKSKTINVNFITDEGKEFSLNLNLKYTIQQVIEKVAQYLQVEISQIQLFYKSALLEALYNSINLYHYWIHDGSTINVTIKKTYRNQPGYYRIFIELLNGKQIALDVLLTDKIRCLLMKLEIETGIPNRKMKLFFKGGIFNPFNNEDPTLEERGIVANSILHLHFSR